MKKIKSKKEMIKIINQIQKVRNKNNINWMDIIRLSINLAPNQTVKILKKINNQDNKISKLFKKISN